MVSINVVLWISTRINEINRLTLTRDFYTLHSTPTGLEDVSRYPQLLATLLEDPAWSEEDIKKLAGLNLLRVFAKVEQVWLGFIRMQTIVFTITIYQSCK